ncbi:MAG: YbhB/YbcL family Raf kinase inhibitor-like protein [Propionibacteriaceae bacterium]|jgi:Raf kinase inhibitor-like YbhB/YbcL family protein|nr:YbhB/YbcL family Raf kinase inhibitor-like protein [Propionibacteriaceae bacterium]
MDLRRPYPPFPYDLLPPAPAFELVSRDITEGQSLDPMHSADGQGLSPHLAWAGFPAATKVFAVSCFDPDAPTPAGYWHWTVVNLPITCTSLPRGFGNGEQPLEAGVARVGNDGGTLGFVGAAPPAGDHAHRYVFAVHALDDALDIADGAISCTPAAFQMLFHTLARATLTVTYQR